MNNQQLAGSIPAELYASLDGLDLGQSAREYLSCCQQIEVAQAWIERLNDSLLKRMKEAEATAVVIGDKAVFRLSTDEGEELLISLKVIRETGF